MTTAHQHDAFLAAVDRIGYTPQGRHAKAGKLRPEDVETLMQGGALADVWTWVQHNVKTTQSIDLLRRNLHAAIQAPTSPDTVALKRRRVAALAEKRRLLHDAVVKLQTDNKLTIANISTAEQAMTSACDPPTHALLQDTYALQAQYRHQERECVVQDLSTLLRPRSSSSLPAPLVIQNALHRLEHLLKQSRPMRRQRPKGPSSPRQLVPPSIATDEAVQDALRVPGKVVLDELIAWHAGPSSSHLSTTTTQLPELTPYQGRRTLHDVESQIQHHMEQLYSQLAMRQQDCDRLLEASSPFVQNQVPATIEATPATTRKLEFLQAYGESLAKELETMDAEAATTANHLAAIASFESRLDQAHKSVAAAFRANRALVVDVLDRQSKLLLYLQTDLVDAFKGLREETEVALSEAMRREAATSSLAAELPQQLETRARRRSSAAARHETKQNVALQRIQTSVAKLEAAKAAFDTFLQTSPCFAAMSWEELLEHVREVDAVVSDEILPDLVRMEEVAVDLLDAKLPALFRAIHNWHDQPAQQIIE